MYAHKICPAIACSHLFKMDKTTFKDKDEAISACEDTLDNAGFGYLFLDCGRSAHFMNEYGEVLLTVESVH